MRISYNWLKDYIPLQYSTEEIKNILTFSGIEVEAVEEMPALQDTIVTAKILSADKVEGSDHLHVCQVDTGDQVHQVVCGAANCRAGITCVLALPGTRLGDITIKAAKLRGVASNGMLCSERELGISENHEGIIELGSDIALGHNVNDLFGLPDTMFEFEITPNRSDLLGLLGIARDLSASTGIPVNTPTPHFTESDLPVSSLLSVDIADENLCSRYTARVIRNVTVTESPLWLKTKLTKIGLKSINNVVDITNLVMFESGHPLHAFDFDLLESTGEIKEIKIRNANDGEIITALDGKNYKLDINDLVIADGVKPIAIAGVIGGMNSHITESTKNIVLESAVFDPGSVRRTAYKYKLTTDSSYRFERHISAPSTDYSTGRAVQIILELAGGSLCKGICDSYPIPLAESILGLRPTRYESIIGYKLSDETILKYLSGLGLEFVQYGDWKAGNITDLASVYCYHAEQINLGNAVFEEKIGCQHTMYFRIPHYRVDLEREIDIIEELARLDGYDKVPQKTTISLIMDRHAYEVKRRAKSYFSGCGFFEVINFSFDDPENIALLGLDETFQEANMISLINPQSSNQSVMRTTLIPQLLKTMQYNINHGESNVRIYEANKVYLRGNDGAHSENMRFSALVMGKNTEEHWLEKNSNTGFYHIKGIVDGLLNTLNLKISDVQNNTTPYLIDSFSVKYLSGASEVLRFGKLKPEVASKFGIDLIDLKQDIWVIDIDLNSVIELGRNFERKFIPIPKFPTVERDISFVISNEVPYSILREHIMKIDHQLICSVNVFDEYKGKQIPEGFRSLSLHIVLNDSGKTLTIERVDKVIDTIINMLLEKWQIKMR
ncbi:MAG: phenylalanine--tRNA ligase subunit beta [Candidatus Cloacimonetes bacterium HGW-Cloacimonetes-1]|jgi:phenylalanyl-tRNA synthetase beta chain|nr:MAG: phenylalanine--tRNA ligase subunit beta [Candidatus Cloacimonetes bacterium HGW-Cloacimonetes-1]